MSVKRSAPVNTPPGFIATKMGHKTCELSAQKDNALVASQHGSISQAMVNEVYGSLLGPNDGPHDYTDPLYLQSINLQAAYDFRVVPFFGDMVTVQVLNNRANFLSTHVCPIWETNEQNFTVNRREFNAVPFTQISELGIPDEQTHFSYSWSDSMEKVAMNARISRDLAFDDNFGQEAWTDELAQFASNATLTVNINIIYAYLDNGWKNITGNVARNEINTDPQRLLMREAEGFLIFPRDSVRGLAMIRNYEDQMPEMDTVIGPGGYMQYMRDVQGEAMTVPSVRPWSNPEVQGLMMEIYDGPDSFKTLQLGNRRLSFFELHPFMTNLKTNKKYQPLTTVATLGQYHPPNPDVTAYDAVNSTNPDQLDMYLYYQTKSVGRDERITMRQRLEHCQYWDKKTRQVSDLAHDYCRHLNTRKDNEENVPWPWNRANPRHVHNAGDINKDDTDYHQANMGEVHNKRSLHDMRSWRALPCGFSYDPSANEYFIPARMGDFMLGQLPNEWALKAVRHFVLKARDRTGHADLDLALSQVDKTVDMLRNARWTSAFVGRLIDKNVVKMMDNSEPPQVIPVRTNPKRLAHFLGAHAVNEFRPNADGALDLPEKDGNISDVTVPPGYLSGPGIVTLAREADKPDSLWHGIGTRARFVVELFSHLHHVARETMGSSDSFDTTYLHPWFQTGTPLAALIDTYVEPEGPVFLGVPTNATSYNTAQEAASTTAGGVATKDVPAFLAKVDAGSMADQQYRITNRERALVIGPRTTAYQVLLYTDPPVDAEFTSIVIEKVVEISGYTRSSNAKRAQSAALIGAEAARVVGKADEQREFLARLAGNENELQNWVKELARNYPNVTGNLAAIKNLKAYEDSPENVRVGTDEGAAPEVNPLTREFRGNYTQAPTTYLRAPLTSSQSLRDYLAGKPFSYVLPADERANYELPEDLETAIKSRDESAMDEDTTRSSSTSDSSSIKSEGTSTLLATGMRSVQFLRYASAGSVPSVASQTSARRRDDLFTPLSVSSVLQMGAPGDFGREDRFTQKSRGRIDRDDYAGQGADDLYQRHVTSRFRGPWKARRRFARNEITSKIERLYFHWLMEAPNTMDAPLRAASVGAELFSVMLVRPFIQAHTDALILTVAGPKTALYAFGHSVVQVSKEARGLFHLTCGFYHGVARLNPDNMQLMLNALPRDFIGGKNCAFMIDPSHYGHANPDKESIQAFLIPVSERGTQASPMNVCNNETYLQEGDGNAIWERKCSAFGGFYNYVYRTHNPAKRDAMQYERTAYGQAVQAATVVHRGPTAYINPATMRKEDVEGEGPSGERVMNMQGSHLVWNGQSHRFPQRSQYDLTNI